MKIGIDLDEVLADTLTEIIKYHNFKYKTQLVKSKFRSYGYWHTWGGTKEQAIKIVHDFYKTPYFTQISPVVGAKKAVRLLKRDHDLFIITSRPKSLTQATHNWLNQHFPNAFSGVYLCNHFSLNGTAITKKKLCDQVGVEVLIEDSLEYALECISSQRKVFLLDYPWNKQSQPLSGIVRCRAWTDVVQAINS